MKMTEKKPGFTIVEVLMSLAILAMLMAAVAVAFDASIVNFQANESISKNMNTARAALLRMTTQIRKAGYDDGTGYRSVGVGVSGDNTQCSLVAPDESAPGGYCDITYRYAADEKILYLDDNISGNSYPLCRNVRDASFIRGTGGTPPVVRNVRMVLTVTDDKGKNPQTLAAAAVVRRNLN